jgi:hypothetical protein
MSRSARATGKPLHLNRRYFRCLFLQKSVTVSGNSIVDKGLSGGGMSDLHFHMHFVTDGLPRRLTPDRECTLEPSNQLAWTLCK